MKATVRTDNNQNQNQLGDWFWFKPHRKERPQADPYSCMVTQNENENEFILVTFS